MLKLCILPCLWPRILYVCMYVHCGKSFDEGIQQDEDNLSQQISLKCLKKRARVCVSVCMQIYNVVFDFDGCSSQQSKLLCPCKLLWSSLIRKSLPLPHTVFSVLFNKHREKPFVRGRPNTQTGNTTWPQTAEYRQMEGTGKAAENSNLNLFCVKLV